MWPYWLIFLVPAFQAVSRVRLLVPPLPVKRWPASWQAMFLLLVLVIGLRHEVGGDWDYYLVNFEVISDLTLVEVLSGIKGDPGDSLLNWLASRSGLGIYLVNSVDAILFSLGLLVFCRNQPRPWLALTVSVPYLITVVAMGYTRQGVAIGLVMMGLVALENKNVFKFLLWVALAATFHKSAVIMVPLAVLSGTRRRLWMLLWVGISAGLLFVLLLLAHVESLVQNYIGEQYGSSGAAIRVAMNALPALIFLLARRRFDLSPTQRTFWTWLACGALAFVVLLYVSPSSTAVDRVALYWIPLQLFIWSRIPDALGSHGAANSVWVYLVVAYSATVHFVWLNFAVNAYLWLPYQFYPFWWLWQ